MGWSGAGDLLEGRQRGWDGTTFPHLSNIYTSGIRARGPRWMGPMRKRGGEIPIWALHPSLPSGSPASSPGPAGRERRVQHVPPAAPPVCGEEAGRGSGGQVVSREAGHANLGAALAQDGELGAPIHPAAGQGRVPVLEVHGEVAVHLPAPPLTLDLSLHLQGARWASLLHGHLSSLVPLPACPGPLQTGPATSSSTPLTPKLQLAALKGKECSKELPQSLAHVTV